MYYYIYDSFLEKPKYRKIIDRIEIKLADLDIAGETNRVRTLRNMEEIVLEGLQEEKVTIVAVGNDHTFKKISNTILTQNKKPLSEITLGLIPISKPNSIGQALGAQIGETACDTISSRIVKLIDLGKVNRQYFLTRALIGFGGRKQDLDKNGNPLLLRAIRYHPREVVLNLDQKFQIRLDLFQAAFVNLSSHPEASPQANPEDGLLNIFITSKYHKFSLTKNLKLASSEAYHSLPKTSIFKAKKVEVSSVGKKPFSIIADNQKAGRTPVTIQAVPQKLRVIVGKTRTF